MEPQEGLLPRVLLPMAFLVSCAIVEQRPEPEVALEITSFLRLQMSPAVLNTENNVALESYLGTRSPAV